MISDVFRSGSVQVVARRMVKVQLLLISDMFRSGSVQVVARRMVKAVRQLLSREKEKTKYQEK